MAHLGPNLMVNEAKVFEFSASGSASTGPPLPAGGGRWGAGSRYFPDISASSICRKKSIYRLRRSKMCLLSLKATDAQLYLLPSSSSSSSSCIWHLRDIASHSNRHDRTQQEPGRHRRPFSFFHTSSFQLLYTAMVTGVVPSPPRFSPSIFIAHRVQQSHCSSTFHRLLLTHALALSASQFVCKKKSPRTCTSMHSGGFELTKLTYTRLEDNLIRHRGTTWY